MKQFKFKVYRQGTSSPLFSGSKTECLRFMAYVLGTGEYSVLTISRERS